MASRSWNRVELIGNLARDPEMRYTPSGAAVVTFSIATNRTYISDGEKKEEADFHRCVAWNKLAELCNQLLKKGHRVFVSGRLQNRSWEDQTSGQNRQITEIVIEDMILLTNKPASSDYEEGVNANDFKSTPAAEPAPEIEKPAPKADKKENSKEDAPKEEAKEEKEEVDVDDLPF